MPGPGAGGALTSHGLKVTLLLCSSHTCMLWRALAVGPRLAAQVLGLLLEKMSKDVPFKESRAFLLGRTPDRVATLLPLSVSRALGATLTRCPCPACLGARGQAF